MFQIITESSDVNSENSLYRVCRQLLFLPGRFLLLHWLSGLHLEVFIKVRKTLKSKGSGTGGTNNPVLPTPASH